MKESLGHLVSCRQTTSGRRSSSHGSSRGSRCLTELTFQVAIRTGTHGTRLVRKRPQQLVERVRGGSGLSRACAGTRLEPHPEPALARRPGLVANIDVGLCADQLAELGVAVVAGVEGRVALDEIGPDLGEVGPAVVLRRARDGRAQKPL